MALALVSETPNLDRGLAQIDEWMAGTTRKDVRPRREPQGESKRERRRRQKEARRGAEEATR